MGREVSAQRGVNLLLKNTTTKITLIQNRSEIADTVVKKRCILLIDTDQT